MSHYIRHGLVTPAQLAHDCPRKHPADVCMPVMHIFSTGSCQVWKAQTSSCLWLHKQWVSIFVALKIVQLNVLQFSLINVCTQAERHRLHLEERSPRELNSTREEPQEIETRQRSEPEANESIRSFSSPISEVWNYLQTSNLWKHIPILKFSNKL